MELIEVGFHQLEEGAKGPEWSTDPVTRTMIVRYAGASGDFNPIHHDETLAQAVGYPSVFAHGMFTAGLLAHYLTDWLGTGSLRRFRVRFKRQVWPGDTLHFRSEVVRKFEEAGEGRVEVRADVLNQAGEVVLEGWAVAAPRR